MKSTFPTTECVETAVVYSVFGDSEEVFRKSEKKNNPDDVKVMLDIATDLCMVKAVM